MDDKTFNNVKIKPKMTLCHSIYKTPTFLLPHQQDFASYTIYIMTAYSYDHKYGVLQRQRQHTSHKTYTIQNLTSKESLCIEENKK